MITLEVQKRDKSWKKISSKEKAGFLPAVFYGGGQKAVSLVLNQKAFEKVFSQAGKSTLITLELEKKPFHVFIKEIQRDPISNRVTHVDLYQPSLNKKMSVMVPLVFEGEATATKELGGTLIKNIQQLQVRALPQDLPHEIQVSVEKLATFQDKILLGDLQLPSGVEIVGRKPEDIVAQVVPPEKVEEELASPVEEKVEEVEKVEKPKKEETEEAPQAKSA